MTPEHQALLSAIRQSPRDDTPRLILADHLEDCGQDARAAYIRLACKAGETERHYRDHQQAGAWRCETCIQHRANDDAADRILTAHKQSWLAAECPLLASGMRQPYRDVLSIDWHRGFPSLIRCEIGWWLENSKVVLEQVPARLEELELCGPLYIEHQFREDASAEFGHRRVVTFTLHAMNDRTAKYSWPYAGRVEYFARVFFPQWMLRFDRHDRDHTAALLSYIWKQQCVSYDESPSDLLITDSDRFIWVAGHSEAVTLDEYYRRYPGMEVDFSPDFLRR